jgi:hypothetical protein
MAEELRELREVAARFKPGRGDKIARELRAADSEPPALRVFRENEP